jgi:O-antigen/teichoic acid export membrane protein
MLLGTLILAGLLWLFGGPIFKFLVAAEYQGAAKYLPLAALAGGIFATGQMLATDAMLQMNSKALVAPKIGSAMVAIVLNYVGAKRFGVAGVVWAGVIASCVYALSLAAVTQRRRSAGPDISEES